MSQTPIQTRDLFNALAASQATGFVNVTYRTATTTTGSPAAGMFYSSITGRGRMVDLSNDLMPRMGIERIMVQQIVRVDGEFGASGESVYKPVNDKYNQIRYVGDWSHIIDNVGARVQTPVSSLAYIEVTFYGTGINLIQLTDSNNRTFEYSVDGGSFSDTAYPPAGNAVLVGRNYACNQIVTGPANLSLGIHTVRFRFKSATTSSGPVYGFEILNESSSVKTAAGSSAVDGKLVTLSALDAQAYNSSFESGVLGTRGGRVLVYQKSDGTIAKAVTPTDASSLTLASTSHANEEVIRTDYWRSFGAGRADDFSIFNGSVASQNRAFALDDGSSTLVGQDIRSVTYHANYANPVFVNASGFVTIVFVGTGIDVIAQNDGNLRDWPSVILDGASLGSYTPAAWSGQRTIRFASGLPYGTHVLRLGGDGGEPGFDTAIVYGPKKPTLPAGAIELAEYNIMANYAATSFTGNSPDYVGSGLLRKNISREMVFNGAGWTIGLDAGVSPSGFQATVATSGAYVECVFFGTGFEFRGESNTTFSATNTVSLQSLSTGGSLQTLNSTNFPGLTTGNINTGVTFTYASGNVSLATANTFNSGFFVSGLALGLYKVRITTGTANTFRIHCFDIVTPIHVHKNNGPFVYQNTLSVGSQGISDKREFDSQLLSSTNCALARGVTSSPTNAGTFAVVPDVNVAHYSKTGTIQIAATCRLSNNSSGQTVEFSLYVDGQIVPESRIAEIQSGVGENIQLTQVITMPVSVGWHSIYMTTNRNGGATDTFIGTQRIVSVIDV